jgi:hypothetical protein
VLSEEDLSSTHAQISNLVKKNRRLYQAYRSVRYQLEDLAPRGAKLELYDEARLAIESDATELEKQQQREVSSLRERVGKLETEMCASC